MADVNQDDTFYSGNKRTLRFTLTNGDVGGSPPLDISGYAIRWALADSRGNSRYGKTPILQKDENGGITVVDAVNGILDVALSSADTQYLSGAFYHELELVDGGLDSVVVATGTLTLLENINNPA
jgi:hypothetical protein